MKPENRKRFCPKCKQKKNTECFTKNRASGDGLCVYCKDCVKKYNRTPPILMARRKANQKFNRSPRGVEINRKSSSRYYWKKRRFFVYSSGASRAYSAVHRAKESGDLIDLRDEWVKCSDCDNRATQYDHRDYGRPLDVFPVCQRCNRLRGRGRPRRSA